MRVDKSSNYVVLDKGFLKDNRLSWKAKGLLSYMLSLPDDWEFYLSELQKHSTDGMSSLKSGFQELQENGYVTRKRERKGDGTFKWTTVIHEVATVEKPLVENPSMEKPLVENRRLLSNDELNNNKLSSSSNAFEFYESNFGMITPFIADKISDWVNALSEELVIESMKIALTNNKQFNYAEGILRDWHKRNVKTLSDVKALEKEFKRKKDTKGKLNPSEIDWSDI